MRFVFSQRFTMTENSSSAFIAPRCSETSIGLAFARGMAKSVTISARQTNRPAAMNRLILFVCCCGCFASATNVLAIPQTFAGGSINAPALLSTPRLNRDLTENFLDLKQWEQGNLDGPWIESTTSAGREISQMTANPILFGSVPGSVRQFRESGKLQEIIITYLDAGRFFGFDLDGEKTMAEKMAGDQRRAEFHDHYKRLSADLRYRFEKGCGSGIQTLAGRTPELKTTFSDYRTDGFLLRLELRENFSIALHILQDKAAPSSLLDPSVEKMSLKDRRLALQKNVITTPRGDKVITGLPSLQQGNTPFCGIHSLGMIAQYHGLRMEADALAAGAEYKNTGNAKGTDIPGLYRAVATELGMKFQLGKSIDRAQLEKLILDGMPILVWRRVSQERDAAHTANSRNIAQDPTAALPPIRDEARAYPDKNNRQLPSHASVICGYNREKGEVIFSEPWGKNARERRMRLEEMEATVYQTFLFKL